MTIIVEDGTGLTTSNSYVTLAGARAILANYGQDLDAVDATAEQQLLSAMRWIESHRARFKGCRMTREQALQFPRRDVYIDGWLLPSDELPTELINGQVFAAYEVAQGADLQANDSGRKIAGEKVDVVDVKYFESSATEASVRYTRANDELCAILNPAGNIPLART